MTLIHAWQHATASLSDSQYFALCGVVLLATAAVIAGWVTDLRRRYWQTRWDQALAANRHEEQQLRGTPNVTDWAARDDWGLR